METRLQGVKNSKVEGANQSVGIYGSKVWVVFVLAVELLGYDKGTLNSCQATPFYVWKEIRNHLDHLCLLSPVLVIFLLFQNGSQQLSNSICGCQQSLAIWALLSEGPWGSSLWERGGVTEQQTD